MKKVFGFKKCFQDHIGLLCIIALFISKGVWAQTNSNSIVGTLGGEVNVSSLGMASYSIPIEVVPGTRGVQPNLAIVYNSSLGRGYLGTNWTISGLSSITRVQRTKYPDGSVGTISFDGNDRYALDGARLMRLSNGNYAASGAVYGTEIENYTRVVLRGTPNAESQYFVAVTDQGQIIEYGKTNKSKQTTASDYSKVLSWMANKVTDEYGNYMTISYENNPSNGDIYPIEINYTGNDGANLTPYAKLLFNYEIDPNTNTLYIGGQRIRQALLLESIQVLYENDLVRKYEFEYDYDRSTRLEAVVLKDATGTELTRTTFEWGSDASSISCKTFESFSDYNIRVGDYNGDNNLDLCLFTINSGTCNWQIKLGDRNGNFVSSGFSGTLYLHNTSRLFTVDLSGRGKDGLGYYQYNSNTHKYTYKVIEAVENPNTTTDYDELETNSVYLGDFLGVGGSQFMFRNNPVGDSVTLKLVKDELQVPLKVHKDSRVSVTDFNGNGKSDLQTVHGVAVDIYEYDEASLSFVKILDSETITEGSGKDFFGDLNGDGKQDYIHYKGGNWYLNMSKGTAYNGDQTLPFYSWTQSNGEPYFPIFVVDINGDGMDDVLQPVHNFNTNKTIINIYYSRGYDNNDFSYLHETFQNDNIYLFGESHYLFADLNCDGKSEMLYTSAIGVIKALVSFGEKREHNLVHSFTNGIGKCSTLEYAYYNSPNIGNFGRDGKRVGFPLVSKQREPNGNGGLTETTYTYGHAEFDFARRQMMGFGLLDIYCNGTNNKMEYQYSDYYHHLNLEKSSAYYMQRGNNVEGGYIGDSTYWVDNRTNFYHYEIVNTLGYLTLAYGRFIPYYSVSSSIDKLKNTHALTRYWLNSGTGRLEKQSIEYRDYKANCWVSRDSIECDYINVPLLNGQTVKKVSSVKTWNKRNGFNEVPFQHTAYYYSHGGLESVSTSDSDGEIGETTYDYNLFGLTAMELYTPYNMPESRQRYFYDEKGRFLVEKSDALGHICSATFDGMTGWITSQTDVNGLTTSYQYDPFGRLVLITRPDLIDHYFMYNWNESSVFPNVVYYVKESETGCPNKTTYYDVLGRVVHTYEAGRGYNDIVYDDLGLVSKTTYTPYSAPNVVAGNKIWHTYTYDNYNRVASETAPYTNLSYSYYDYNNPTMHDFFVCVDDSIRDVKYTKKYDALGRITQSIDPVSSVNYSYAYETVSGAIRDKMTVSIGGSTTTVVSDIRGNRLRIQDPDAGTVTSTYNVLNQLVNRVDANGNQSAYSYDLIGRTTQVVYSNGNETETITYTYDDAEGAGIGQLASVKKNGNNDCIFEYDRIGRIATRKIFDGNNIYKHKYEYNSLGQLQYFTYPDDYCIKNVYNSYGELEQIRDRADNSLIYAADTRNKFRQPLKCRYGNETGVQYTYNAYGLLTAIKNGDVVGSYNVNSLNPGDVDYSIDGQYRVLNYAYDDRGFIASRSDSKVNQTETYTYDNLDRLTSYTVNGIVAASFTYSNTGNINTNSKVGTYSYSNNKPHAVTGIAGNIACPISASQCDVTYNLRNRPSVIAENGYSITLDYDAAGMRRHSYFRHGNSNLKSRARISDVHEVEIAPGLNRRLDYIYAEGQLVAVHVKRGSVDSLYYVMTDHLGSWNKVIDESKNIVQQTHFDPWGNRMSYTAWNTPQTQISFSFDRGFTGHEHYDRFKIINANARLYDPVIGRFFSPDPFVQAPDFSQNYNRYSYCLNNPVMYSDPNGESILAVSMIVGAVVCAYLGGTAANGWNYNPCSWSWDGKTWAGVGVGAVIGAGVGAAFACAAPSLASTAFMSHFGTRGTMASYTMTGFATLGAGGYAAGFGGGMLYSNGDIRYSHLSGVQGFKVGATVGALAGQLAGDIVTYKPPQEVKVSIRPKSKWKGNYYQGSEQEARQLLLESSKFFNAETAMWYTSRGYYYEPISGDMSYTYTYSLKYNDEYDFMYFNLDEYNVPNGPRTNTINTANLFSELDFVDGNLYLYPTDAPAAQVYYRAHTHPSSGEPGKSDNRFSFLFGIPCRVYGWNGSVYYYGGPGYWR